MIHQFQFSAIDESFIQSILNILLDPEESKRELANVSLSYVPTFKKLVFLQENKLRLLLSENHSDATKRFFIACGDRQAYLQQDDTLF